MVGGGWERALRAAGIEPEAAARAVGADPASMDALGLAKLAVAHPGCADALWSSGVEAPLAGRLALVTGATSGFGAATARRLHALGATVVGTGRRAERLARLGDELGERFLASCFDVRDDAAVDAALAALPGGAPDIVVSNAGLALGLEPGHRASWDDWETMIATNVRAVARLAHQVLPGMVARGSGHVVHVASVAGSWPYPGGNVYGATKAFVIQLTLNLKAELIGTGVRVTSVEPGMAETEFSLVRFKDDAAAAAKPYQGLDPLTAEDIADAIGWAVTRPAHVNINRIEVMPTAQGFGPFAVHRRA
jgi:3-hydroxy acid dehydrogenase/malonic semialdehyde reductase